MLNRKIYSAAILGTTLLAFSPCVAYSQTRIYDSESLLLNKEQEEKLAKIKEEIKKIDERKKSESLQEKSLQEQEQLDQRKKSLQEQAQEIEKSRKARARESGDGCEVRDSVVGVDLKLKEECFFKKQDGHNDAYYRVEFRINLGNGFVKETKFKSTNFFKRIIHALTGSRDTKSINFFASLESGGVVHKNIPLFSFTKEQGRGKMWTSAINNNYESKFFKLSASESINVQVNYAYSEEKSVNFIPIAETFLNIEPKIASSSIKPFFAIANDFTNAIISQNNITVMNNYVTKLGDSKEDEKAMILHKSIFRIGEFLEEKITSKNEKQCMDEKKNTDEKKCSFVNMLAEVRVILEGKKSMGVDAGPYATVGNSLSDILSSRRLDSPGRLDSSDINEIARNIAARPRLGSNATAADRAALMATAIGSIPLGKIFDKPTTVSFCRAMRNGLDAKYSASSFDKVMIRAQAVDELITVENESQIDKFKLCFDPNEIKLIRKYTHINSSQPTNAKL